MFNSYRNGAFALGLVVGGGIALNLFLWLDYQAKRECQNNADQCQTGDNSQIGTIWDGLVGTFVSPSDTLAQWIMAFFTIAATGVLVLTLRSANKTNKAAVLASTAALEANKIMREERRPWVEATFKPSGEIIYNPKNGVVVAPFHVSLNNRGNSPALDVTLNGALGVIRRDKEKGALRYKDEVNKLAPIVMDRAIAAHKKNLRQVIFPNDNLTYGLRNFRSYPNGVILPDDEEFDLIAAIVVLYSTGAGQFGGAIFASLLTPEAGEPDERFRTGTALAEGRKFSSIGDTPKYF